MASKNKRGAMRWIKRSLWALAGLGLVAMIVVAFLPKPVPVDTVEARRTTLRVTVDEDGRTRVSDRYTVGAPLAGNLARLELHPGDAVEEGQVLARIVPLARPLMDAQTRVEAEARVAASQAQLRQARASVQRARAALDYARSEADRQRQLVERGTLAQQAMDRASLERRSRQEELTSAEFGVRVAAHQLEMARSALGRFDGTGTDDAEQLELASPIQGVVLRVLRESAGVVQPGTPLLELGDPTHLEIAVDVLTSDSVRIEPGQRVVIERWGGEGALDGHVRAVEPSAFTRTSALGVEEQRVNVVIDLDSDREAWARLGDGYRVETRIVIWEEEGVLTVPSNAVFRSDDGWAAYVVEGGVARLTPLTLGRRNGLAVQVLEGLSEGATVIAHPSDRVVDGVEVEAR